MTVSTTASSCIFLGNSSATSFTIPFIMDSAANIQVTYTGTNGIATILSPTAYTLTINPPATNAIWGIGGSLVYPLTGSPIASGTSLAVQRILPLTQLTSISNQGDFYPQAVETAIDEIEFQIQQVSANRGAYRAIWVSGAQYNFGDIVQDGLNGAGTFNVYTCAIANTAGGWATDLAAGDWSLVLNAQSFSPGALPITGGTITGNLSVNGTTTSTGGFFGNLLGNVAGNVIGNASTVTTNANLTGPITSTGNATSVTNNAITVPMLSSAAYPAGFVNKFRNPGMVNWSRGTSITVSSGTTVYTADGWYVGTVGAAATVNQAGGLVYSGNTMQITGNTGMTDTFIKQRIESFDSAPLQGQQVTVRLQCWNNSTGATLTPTLTVKTPTVADNYGSTNAVLTAASLQPILAGVSQVEAYTFTCPSSAINGLEVTVDFGAALNTNSKIIFLTDFATQATPGVTTGLNSSPPVPELPNITSDMARNARYLPPFGTVAGPIGTGAATSTSASGFFIPFHTPTRVAPTGLTVVTAGDFEIATYAGSDVVAVTGLTFSKASTDGAFVTAAVSGTPLTSAVPYFLYAKTALAGNLIFSGAEL